MRVENANQTRAHIDVPPGSSQFLAAKFKMTRPVTPVHQELKRYVAIRISRKETADLTLVELLCVICPAIKPPPLAIRQQERCISRVESNPFRAVFHSFTRPYSDEVML